MLKGAVSQDILPLFFIHNVLLRKFLVGGDFFRASSSRSTVKWANFGIGINFDNCTSIHIIPPGYLVN